MYSTSRHRCATACSCVRGAEGVSRGFARCVVFNKEVCELGGAVIDALQ